MATTIVIKNSAVAGKVPDASALVAAELALNLKDRKLYSKDADGNVFEIAGGEGANVPGGPTPPTNGNEIGDLFFDTTLNQLLYWDGSQWLPIAGNEVHNLGDLLDVEILNPAEGELLVWNGTNWENADPGYLTESEVINILEGKNPDGTDKPGGEEYAKLSDIGDGTITIVDAEGDPVGEFTVNQDGDTEITLPEIPVPEDQIHVGDTYPGTPTIGDLWVNTGECPPVFQIFDDCDDPGNPTWKPIGGGTTDGISFNAVILDDGTPEANTPGHILTAVAENITGGTSPNEYEYKWLVDGLTMGQNKTLNIINTFVGKIVTCDITVAEPDGSDPVTRTAVYSRVIEVAGSIVKPSIIAPADGAGEMVTAVSDEIIGYSEVGDNGVVVDDGKVVKIQGAPYNDGTAEELSEGEYYKFFDILTYTNPNDGRTSLEVCEKVWLSGNDGYGNSAYHTATRAVGETNHQRTLIDGNQPESYVQFEMGDTGDYYLYAGDNGGTNARKADISFITAVGTVTEEVSPVNANVSRLKFTVTTPGTVRIIAAGVYGLYFYASSFSRQKIVKQLTLAGPKDLDVFAAGDDVEQDSGHTPTTSVITGAQPLMA